MIGSMSPYSVTAGLACTAIVLGLVATPIFRAADVPPNPKSGRQAHIDGLRGFLALGVFLHHATITRGFLIDSAWQLPPSRFYVMTGQVGVSLFFMITGYLFWSSLIREAGRPDWLALYVGRIFRIGPLYIFAIGTMFVIVWLRTDLTLKVPLDRLAWEAGRWLSLGIVEADTFNGSWDTGLVLAGVTWTLRYEWLFYAALLPLSLPARVPKAHLPFVVLLLLICVAWRISGGPTVLSIDDPIYALLFVAGMASASLRAIGLTLRLPDPLLSSAASAILVLVMAGFPTAYGLLCVLLLGIVFFLIISGASFYGLIRSRPARRLGDISYGIYLVQGPVLTIVFAAPIVRRFALQGGAAFWLSVLAAAMALVGLALVTHVWIERTGIDLGKKVSRLLHETFLRPDRDREPRRELAAAAPTESVS